jgi:hypothetical protein
MCVFSPWCLIVFKITVEAGECLHLGQELTDYTNQTILITKSTTYIYDLIASDFGLCQF